MTEIKIVSFVLWLFVATILSIFFVIALMVHFTNQDKLFKYYALYCFFTLLYVLSKYDFTFNYFNWAIDSVNNSFNWAVQFVFNGYYLLFGLSFLQFPKYRPRLSMFVRKYAVVVLAIGVSIFILGFTSIFTELHYLLFFTYGFLPIHLSLALLIIFIILKTKSYSRYYFVIGSLIYMIFAIYAYLASYAGQVYPDSMMPIDFFYIAIILECFIFSYGLAQYIRRIYKEKILIQQQLAHAQLQVRQRLEQELALREQENLTLLEERQRQELISEVLRLQQKVMRTQINSHFIFNVLNSIKYFIQENDIRSASFYLTRFAKFIRRALESSEQEYSTLNEEIKSLDLYLSIEKMRFNHKFSYQIDTTPGIKFLETPFPPLLLQPFVENALWHGLMPIEREALLLVKVFELENHIEIWIDDNGIGFKNRAPNSNSHKQHKSLGIVLINERINFYNKRSEHQITYQIIDKSEDDLGQGTRVILSLKRKKSSDKIIQN